MTLSGLGRQAVALPVAVEIAASRGRSAATPWPIVAKSPPT
jgi:hypothetical protein